MHYQPATHETIRRVLGLAIQILEDAPENLRPESNMDDMRRLLEDLEHDTGRNSTIIAQAAVIVLAFMSKRALSKSPWFDERRGSPAAKWTGFTNSVDEFYALFELLGRIHPSALAQQYIQACSIVGSLP